jgi:cation diffusion facilitator family transporter
VNPVSAGRRIAITSMLVSAALAAAKITIGLHAHGSTATVSDGIESAGDVLASGLVLLGLIIAAKPPDEEHPYGHGRLETLSALAVGMMLVPPASSSLRIAPPVVRSSARPPLTPSGR